MLASINQIEKKLYIECGFAGPKASIPAKVMLPRFVKPSATQEVDER